MPAFLKRSHAGTDRTSGGARPRLAGRPAAGIYSLDLGITTVPNVFCPFCGGLSDGPRTARPPSCGCGSLEAWAADPHVPVEWGTIGKNMFGLRCRGETIAAIAIWFCPACGGRARDGLGLEGAT